MPIVARKYIPEKTKVNDAPATFATRVPLVQEPAPLLWVVSIQDVKESYSIRGSEGNTRAILIVPRLASPSSCPTCLLDRLAEARITGAGNSVCGGHQKVAPSESVAWHTRPGCKETEGTETKDMGRVGWTFETDCTCRLDTCCSQIRKTTLRES